MAGRGNSSENARKQWLLEGVPAARRRDRADDDRAPRQWLAIPTPVKGSDRQRRRPAANRRRERSRSVNRRRGLGALFGIGREGRAAEKLRLAEELIGRQRKEIAMLKRRLRESQMESERKRPST